MAFWNTTTPLLSQEVTYGNNGLIVPRYVATRTISLAQGVAATNTILITGSPGWFLGGMDMVMNAGSSIAAAANVAVTVQSGSTTLFVVGSSIPVTPTTEFKMMYTNYNLNLFARTLNDNLQFTINRTFLTGNVVVTAYYSLAPADTVGL